MEAALLNTCSGEVEHFLDNGEVKGFARLESGEKTKIGPNSEAIHVDVTHFIPTIDVETS